MLSCYLKYISWIILAFASLNVIFLGGKRRAFGSFVASLKQSYPNITLTELNWIGDSYSAFGYMTTSITTALIIHTGKRYRIFQFLGAFFVLVSCISSSYVPNPHWLFLTHTLFHGIGSSLILSTIGLVINEHFDASHKYHILATTLVSGGSVASIVFVIFFAYLIQHHHWRWTFKALGIIYFVVTGSAAIVFQRPHELEKYEFNKKKEKKLFNHVVKCRQYPLVILWLLDRILISAVTYGLLMNLTEYLHRNGQTLVRSSTLTVLFASGEAVTYLIGAVLTALTKDLLKDRLKYILLITTFMMSLALIFAELCVQITWAFETLLFVSGFCLGPSITFLYPAGEEMTMLPGHIAYPISLGGMGFGMMVSPLLSAKMAEMLNYKWFFMIQGGLIFVKFIILLLMIILAKLLLRRNPVVNCLIVNVTDQ